MGTEESGLVATVSITTSPLPAESVDQLRHQVERVLEYAESRVVICDEDAKGATEDLSIMAGLKKAIEEKRTSYTKPINDEVTAINALFKTVSEPLERAYKLTKQKVLDYQDEQDRQKAEAERINAMKHEVAKAEMALHGEILPGTDTTPVEVPGGASKHVRATMGMASRTKDKKWRLIDIKLVPDDLKIVDGVKVGKLVRAGIGSIPGIEIYEEPNLVVTPKKG